MVVKKKNGFGLKGKERNKKKRSGKGVGKWGGEKGNKELKGRVK